MTTSSRTPKAGSLCGIAQCVVAGVAAQQVASEVVVPVDVSEGSVAPWPKGKCRGTPTPETQQTEYQVQRLPGSGQRPVTNLGDGSDKDIGIGSWPTLESQKLHSPVCHKAGQNNYCMNSFSEAMGRSSTESVSRHIRRCSDERPNRASVARMVSFKPTDRTASEADTATDGQAWMTLEAEERKTETPVDEGSAMPRPPEEIGMRDRVH